MPVLSEPGACCYNTPIANFTEVFEDRLDRPLREVFIDDYNKESQKPIKYFNREPNERPNSTPDRP